MFTWVFSLQGCLGSKTGYIVVTFFQKFLTSFDTLLQNLKNLHLHFIMILGDFNFRSYSSCSEDMLPVKENHIDCLTSMYGLHQVISEPTHILSQSSSCTDLIFSDQWHLVTYCGIHASLHPNYHHQIAYCKLNLQITYPRPYKRLVLGL